MTDAVVDKLFSRPLPPLEPAAPWDTSLGISALDEPPLVIAALHLANDDIDACHEIAQDNEGVGEQLLHALIQNSTADLLHATLHRREGDYWNSKYWYARVDHPERKPDAAEFVDACEARRPGAEERQWEEMKSLVCWVRENCK